MAFGSWLSEKGCGLSDKGRSDVSEGWLPSLPHQRCRSNLCTVALSSPGAFLLLSIPNTPLQKKVLNILTSYVYLNQMAGEGSGTPLQYSCLENPMDGEPGRLQSMGSWRIRHDWATSLSLFTFMHWKRKWQPTPVFLPGESQGWGNLVGCCPWGRTESDMTEVT